MVPNVMPVFESHSRKLGLQFAQWGEIFCKALFYMVLLNQFLQYHSTNT